MNPTVRYSATIPSGINPLGRKGMVSTPHYLASQAGLDALKPGGVLAAVLYSGKVIGNAEKKAAAEFFRSLPLADYTVLICEFSNWADTAPLPCFVIKREK